MKLRPELRFRAGQQLNYFYREFPYGIKLSCSGGRCTFTFDLTDAVPVRRKVVYEDI